MSVEDDKTRILPPMAKTDVGTQLSGIYELDERIASGGMGEVYRGHNIQTGDHVAIKIVLPEFARDQTILSLFRKEASILNHLAHDAVVRYHVFTIDPGIGRPYLAMEFVDGESLADMMRRGPMPAAEVRRLCHRVASGLSFVHKAGAVHRDLSPDNIILPGGRVERAKIIDFGIARSNDIGGETLIGGRFAGKYNYVSPEQLGLYGGEVTEKSDIYSLGLVLAAVLRGSPLDMKGSQFEIVEKRRSVPDLSGIDEDFASILEAMLQPDPKHRPTGAEIARMSRDETPAEIEETSAPLSLMRQRQDALPKAAQLEVSQPWSDGTGPASSSPPSQAKDGGFVRHVPPPRLPQRPAKPAPVAKAAEPVKPRRTGMVVAGAAALAALAVGGAYLGGLLDFSPTGGGDRPDLSASLSKPPATEPADTAATPPPTPEIAEPAEQPAPSAPAKVAAAEEAPAPADPAPAETAIATDTPQPIPPKPEPAPAKAPEQAAAKLPEPAPTKLPEPAPARAPEPLPAIEESSAPAEPVDRAQDTTQPPAIVPPAESAEQATPQPAPEPAAPVATETPPAQPTPEPETAVAMNVPKPEVPAAAVDEVATRVSWLRHYQGGDCFYATATSATDKAMEIEGYGTAAEPFVAMMGAFQNKFGIEPDISVRLIDPAQCEVTHFLNALGNAAPEKPDLTLDQTSVPNGTPISGTLQTLGGMRSSLLLVDHKGMVFNLDDRAVVQSGKATFSVPIGLGAAERASGKIVPQIIIAITGASDIDAATFANPTSASIVLPAILAEIQKKKLAFSATAKYFQLGG